MFHMILAIMNFKRVEIMQLDSSMELLPFLLNRNAHTQAQQSTAHSGEEEDGKQAHDEDVSLTFTSASNATTSTDKSKSNSDSIHLDSGDSIQVSPSAPVRGDGDGDGDGAQCDVVKSSLKASGSGSTIKQNPALCQRASEHERDSKAQTIDQHGGPASPSAPQGTGKEGKRYVHPSKATCHCLFV